MDFPSEIVKHVVSGQTQNIFKNKFNKLCTSKTLTWRLGRIQPIS